MATFFACTVLSCLLLAYWKRKRNNYVEIEFHNKIFQLRDELRSLVIEGKLSADDNFFHFFDLSLSRTINESYSLTLFYAILFGTNKSEEKSFVEFKEQMTKKLADNKELRLIKEKWEDATAQYIAEQHKISFTFLIPVIRSIGALQGFSKVFKQTIESILISPEVNINRSKLSL